LAHEKTGQNPARFALFDVHCMMEAAPLARTWFCHGEIM